MVQRTGSMPALDAEHEEHHPSDRTYVTIAIVLAIVTAIEVAIYYIPAFEGILVPALIVLSAIKFFYVVAYFMHLKMDPKLLAGVFGSALVVAMAVYIAVGIMMDHRSVDIFFGGQ
jgi:cytochrome c oxidase subunit IV